MGDNFGGWEVMGWVMGSGGGLFEKQEQEERNSSSLVHVPLRFVRGTDGLGLAVPLSPAV